MDVVNRRIKILDKKRKIGVTITIAAILLALAVSVLFLGINKVMVNSGKSMPFVTYKETRESGFTDLIGFGYGTTVYKEEASEGTKVLVEECYNKIAGTVSTWNGEMTLFEYKEWEKDLNCVNGMIIKSETADDSITYYYENGEVLKVNFISKIEHTYKHEIDNNDEITKTSEVDGITYTEYSSGIVKKTYYQVEGAQEEINFVSSVYFSIVNFLYSYAIVVMVFAVVEITIMKLIKF